jgi:hypothetical protein
VRGCTEVLQKFSPAFAIASDHIRDGVPTASRVEEEIKKRGYTAFSDYPRHLTVYAKNPQAGAAAFVVTEQKQWQRRQTVRQQLD